MKATLRELETRLRDLQIDVGCAKQLTDELVVKLEDLISDCRETCDYGPLWVHAIMLHSCAVLKFGLTCNDRYRNVVEKLRLSAQLPYDESMAAKWILGRVRLAIAAQPTASHSVRLRNTKVAYELFSAIEYRKLGIPVLLPGVRLEYPQNLYEAGLFSDSTDPLVSEIHPPYRYQLATLASLIDLDPSNQRGYLDLATVDRAVLSDTHPEAHLGKLNGLISTVSLGALSTISLPGFDASSTRLQAEKLVGTIEAARTTYELTDRKADEWLATSHAVIALTADTANGMNDAFEYTSKKLAEVFSEHYPLGLPDFATVDRVYERVFRKVNGGGPADFNAYLKTLLPRISNIPRRRLDVDVSKRFT